MAPVSHVTSAAVMSRFRPLLPHFRPNDGLPRDRYSLGEGRGTRPAPTRDIMRTCSAPIVQMERGP